MEALSPDQYIPVCFSHLKTLSISNTQFKWSLILQPNRHFATELTLCQRNDVLSTKYGFWNRNGRFRLQNEHFATEWLISVAKWLFRLQNGYFGYKMVTI